MAITAVSVTGTATQLVATRTGRIQLIVIMNDSVADVNLGFDNTVLTTTGLLLQGVKGTPIPFIDYEGALWGITSGGTATVRVVETW